MRSSNVAAIGVLAAIPFLLSLLVLAAFVYAANAALAAADREALARRAAERARIVVGADDQRARLAALHDQRRALEERLTGLLARGEQAENARASRGELEDEIAAVRREIADLEGRINGLGREIEAKERVPATALVPAGSRRPAVFAECDAEGILLMPEGRRLGAMPTTSERDGFLRYVETTGYAVFLVRPKGIEAFDAYRRVLEEAATGSRGKIDVGFEPIDEDWKLAYPKQGPGGTS
jgi:hypothetical protein